MSISSSLVKQLARPEPAGVVDLVPLVQGGCCRSEHDEKLLLEAQKPGQVQAAVEHALR